MTVKEQHSDARRVPGLQNHEHAPTSAEHPITAQDRIDATVRQLDPLNADELFELMADANDLSDTQSLCTIGDELVKRANRRVLSSCSYEESLAMLRDLGMLAASLAKFNLLVDSVPGLEQLLLQLGSVTEEVPRDTVFSYGPRNPQQPERMRKFTTTDAETVFIESFSEGMKHLGAVILALETALAATDPDEIATNLRAATEQLTEMTQAIVRVRRKIPPEVFTYQLRPFFDPVTVGGQSYLAPGGAQMPVIIVDKLVWGIGREYPEFEEYFQENLQYHPRGYREFWQELSNTLTQNLVDRLIELTQQPDSNGTYTNALEELLTFINTLIKFRVPHLKVATDNFQLREGDEVGSGGYQPTILEQLLEATKAARSQVQSAL